MRISAEDARDMVTLTELQGLGPTALSHIYWWYNESTIRRTLKYYDDYGILQQDLPRRRRDLSRVLLSTYLSRVSPPATS